MSLQIGQGVPDGGQFLADVFISNAGKASCLIPRQPSVQLVSDVATDARGSIDVAPAEVNATTTVSIATDSVVVPGRGNLVATLTYISGPDAACDTNGPWVPSRMVVTLDNGVELTAGWANGSVDDCQEGATHPGTFVGPFKKAG